MGLSECRRRDPTNSAKVSYASAIKSNSCSLGSHIQSHREMHKITPQLAGVASKASTLAFSRLASDQDGFL